MNTDPLDAEFQRIQTMTEEQLDAEIRAEGGDPDEWAARAGAAIGRAIAQGMAARSAETKARSGGQQPGAEATRPEESERQASAPPRFFFDHGKLHDRETGQHLHTEADMTEARCDAASNARDEMRATDPWRRAVDAALVSAGLDCLAPDADATASVRRLLEWHETTVLDPAISERAQALIERGQASAPQVVAWVPVHPRTGPLWAMTTAEPDRERLPSYPLMALAQASAPSVQVPQSVLTDEQRAGLVVEAIRPMLQEAVGTGHWGNGWPGYWPLARAAVAALASALPAAQQPAARKHTEDQLAAAEFFHLNPSAALLALDWWHAHCKAAQPAAQQQACPSEREQYDRIINEAWMALPQEVRERHADDATEYHPLIAACKALAAPAAQQPADHPADAGKMIAQPAVEPVAWMAQSVHGKVFAVAPGGMGLKWAPLYASPTAQPAAPQPAMTAASSPWVTLPGNRGRIDLREVESIENRGEYPDECTLRMRSGQRISVGAGFNKTAGESADYWLRRVSEAKAAQPAAEPVAPIDRAFALTLLSEAAKSGHAGTMKLAAQLAGVPACEGCGYVKQHCRCAPTATTASAGAQEQQP